MKPGSQTSARMEILNPPQSKTCAPSSQRGCPTHSRVGSLPACPQFHSLVEEVTQETLLRVLDQMGTFEGRSQFTTWVHKIAIRIALTELRRKRWRDTSLDELTENEDMPPPQGLLEDAQASPENLAERADMLTHVRRVIDEELTDRQRKALTMLAIQDISMEDAARKLKTNRNALYKLLHDARLRLKNRLAMENISAQDVMSLFEEK